MSSFSIEDSEYKCSLSESLLEKSKKELNEDPKTRLIEVKTLRSKLLKTPGLKPRTDINFLLSFLRARKFDQERSFENVKALYDMRKNGKDLFEDLKPSRIKHVLEDGVFDLLKHRNNNGCRVLILRPGSWDPQRYHVTEIIKVMYLVLFKLAQEEDTQVNGIHLIENLDGMSWAQALHMTPGVTKRMVNIIQNVMPLRMKRFDVVNEPTFFDIIYPIVKQFMKEKLVKRIHLNGKTCEGIHTVINPDHLPTDLGGKEEPASNKEWMEEFLRSDAYFEEDNKYGYVDMTLEGKKKGASKVDAGMAGLGGTFKKLDI